jgi:hypothetical protein
MYQCLVRRPEGSALGVQDAVSGRPPPARREGRCWLEIGRLTRNPFPLEGEGWDGGEPNGTTAPKPFTPLLTSPLPGGRDRFNWA